LTKRRRRREEHLFFPVKEKGVLFLFSALGVGLLEDL